MCQATKGSDERIDRQRAIDARQSHQNARRLRQANRRKCCLHHHFRLDIPASLKARVKDTEDIDTGSGNRAAGEDSFGAWDILSVALCADERTKSRKRASST